MNADPMVQRCFRHQWPEAYGRPEVSSEFVPSRPDEMPASAYATVVPEAPTGNGEVLA